MMRLVQFGSKVQLCSPQHGWRGRCWARGWQPWWAGGQLRSACVCQARPRMGGRQVGVRWVELLLRKQGMALNLGSLAFSGAPDHRKPNLLEDVRQIMTVN